MEPLFPEPRGGEPRSLSGRILPLLKPVAELDDAELLVSQRYDATPDQLRHEIDAIEHLLLDVQADEQPIRLRPSDRGKARDRLPILRRELDEAIERAKRAAERGRPAGCWCLGHGGRGRHGALIGTPVDVANGVTEAIGQALMVEPESGVAIERAETYCTCPEGIERREREGGRRALFLAGYNAGKAESELLARWRQSGLPPLASIYSLDQYPQDSPERRRTMKSVAGWKPPQWLYLHGGLRTGKTTIAKALALKALRMGYSVRWWLVSEMMDHLRAGFDKGVSQADLMRELFEVDFLFLDDIGATPAREYVFDRLLQLLDHRLEYRLTTVLTSNFPLGPEESGLVSVLLGEDTTAGAQRVKVAADSPQRVAFAHRIDTRITERALAIKVSGAPLRVPRESMQPLDW